MYKLNGSGCFMHLLICEGHCKQVKYQLVWQLQQKRHTQAADVPGLVTMLSPLPLPSAPKPSRHADSEPGILP